MSAADWRVAVTQCFAAHQLLGMLKIDELIAAGERAETLGPILDPTLWIKKADDVKFNLELLKAAQTFVATVDATIAKAKERAA